MTQNNEGDVIRLQHVDTEMESKIVFRKGAWQRAGNSVMVDFLDSGRIIISTLQNGAKSRGRKYYQI